MMNLDYVLDTMTTTGYPIPEYVHYRTKDGAVSRASDTDDDILDSREKVWLAAVKLACTPMPPFQHDLLFKKIAVAASRYGIHSETDEAVRYVERLGTRIDGIRTITDFEKAATWLRKYAAILEDDVRVELANHLLDKTTKLGHVLSMAERFELNEWAGRDPYTPEVRELAERHLHKLASGNIYRTDQFTALSLTELQEVLPDLAKTASLGMDMIEPRRLGKCATALPEHQAAILDILLTTHGQEPAHSDAGAPIEINDAILAAL
jgi:hypothetical protein